MCPAPPLNTPLTSHLPAGAAPKPAADPARALPAGQRQTTTGCSGEGAASAIQQWWRQHEERERVLDGARSRDASRL